MEKILDTDLQEYKFLSALEVLPGGQQAVLVCSSADMEENNYHSDLCLLDVATGQYKALTTRGDARSFAPYSENSVIFPAVRAEADQNKMANGQLLTVFYEIAFDGGEAREAFRLPLAGASAHKVRDGLYLITAVHDNARPDFDAMKGEAREKAWKEYQEEKDYQVCDEAPFWGNGRGFTNKKRNRLWLYDVKKEKLTAVTEPMFETRGYAISPCGSTIAIAGALVDRKLNMYSGIYLYDIETGRTKELFAPDRYSGIYAMAWLGGKVMFSAEEHGPDWMRFAGTNLYSADPATGAVKLEIPVAESQDFGGAPGSDCRYGGGVKIKALGDTLYYVSSYAHDSAINVWKPGTEARRLTNEECSVDIFDFCGDMALTVGFAGNDLQEVYRLDLASGQQKRLTNFNAAALKDKYVATPEPLTFVNKEGNTIEGWVLKPIDYDETKKYPAALDIHGGPRTIFGTCFFHQMQVMASDGCFVMFCNPTGSGGRGDKFADISGRYGTIDYEDLMQFVDVVLEKYPAIDPGRLGVLGGSYGGFMCNWIIGHNSRFAAAASQRSIASWITLYGTCDIGLSFDLREVQATPFTDMYKMWEQSPMKYADKARTPTLFINSTEDYRCWMPEGISMYTALQLNGVPTRMCIFKGENHELSRSGKPRHRVRRLREIRNWLYRYIMEEKTV